MNTLPYHFGYLNPSLQLHYLVNMVTLHTLLSGNLTLPLLLPYLAIMVTLPCHYGNLTLPLWKPYLAISWRTVIHSKYQAIVSFVNQDFCWFKWHNRLDYICSIVTGREYMPVFFICEYILKENICTPLYCVHIILTNYLSRICLHQIENPCIVYCIYMLIFIQWKYFF